MSSITASTPSPLSAIPSDSLPADEAQVNKPKWSKTTLVALKALAALAFVGGIPLCIAGTVVAIKGMLAGGMLWGVWEGGIRLALGCLYLTLALLSNPVTALGAMFTVPAAIVFALLPFCLAFLMGGLPGMLCAGLGWDGFRAVQDLEARQDGIEQQDNSVS